MLSLTLLVLGIPRANDPNHPFAADDLAMLTELFDAASNLHTDPRRPVDAELDSLTRMG
jgi:hypothetical protein